MIVKLQRSDASMTVPERIWEVLLSVANQRDWQPLGPDLPGQRRNEDPSRYETVDWRPDYFTPEGQFVTAEDANGIAVALEKFFPEIPDQDDPVGVDDRTHLAELPVSPHELFRGEGKQLVREFIDFCFQDGFFVR